MTGSVAPDAAQHDLDDAPYAAALWIGGVLVALTALARQRE